MLKMFDDVGDDDDDDLTFFGNMVFKSRERMFCSADKLLARSVGMRVSEQTYQRKILWQQGDLVWVDPVITQPLEL